MEQKVSREVAESELEKWFDYKRTSKVKRNDKDMETLKEVLIESICDGVIQINEDLTITHNLIFPIKDKLKINYKPRVNIGIIESKIRQSKVDSKHGILIASIAAITDEEMGIIRALDNSDFEIASCIYSFF